MVTLPAGRVPNAARAAGAGDPAGLGDTARREGLRSAASSLDATPLGSDFVTAVARGAIAGAVGFCATGLGCRDGEAAGIGAGDAGVDAGAAAGDAGALFGPGRAEVPDAGRAGVTTPLTLAEATGAWGAAGVGADAGRPSGRTTWGCEFCASAALDASARTRAADRW